MAYGLGKCDAREQDVENTATRIPVIICVDTSGSMLSKNEEGLSRIDRVKRGIDAFYNEIRSNPNAIKAVSLCIVGYNDNPYIVREFDEIKPNEKGLDLKIKGSGKGDLGKGALESIKLLNQRKEFYSYNDINYKQPFLILMSDGHSTAASEDIAKSNLAKGQKEALELEGLEKLTVLPVYIGKDFETDKRARKELGGFSKVNKTIDVEKGGFFSFFRMLGRSVSASSNGKDVKFNTDDDGNFDDDFD